jgi:hypothetical protein
MTRYLIEYKSVRFDFEQYGTEPSNIHNHLPSLINFRELLKSDLLFFQ